MPTIEEREKERRERRIYYRKRDKAKKRRKDRTPKPYDRNELRRDLNAIAERLYDSGC